MTEARKIDKQATTLAIIANSMNTNVIDAICYTGLVEDVVIALHMIAEQLREDYPEQNDDYELGLQDDDEDEED